MEPARPEAGPRPEPSVAELPESEAFQMAWSTLEAAEAEPPVLDRHPLGASDGTFLDLLLPLLRDRFRAHPPEPAAFPAVAVQVLALLEDPDPPVPALLRLIEQDPAISARVLQVANSPYYHRGRDVLDLPGAVMKLGIGTTGEVAVAVAGRSLFDVGLKTELELFRSRLRELYQGSMAVAFAAREFAEQRRVGTPQHLFLAGMFHDIGHTLALRALSALMIAGRVPRDLPALALDALLERTHVEMGAAAHEAWKLPPHLHRLCAHHHDPEVPLWPGHEDLHVLRAVSGLHRLALDPRDPSHAAETRQSLQALALSRPEVAALFDRLPVHRAQVAAMTPA